MSRDFDRIQAAARCAYWQGVRDAQLGDRRTVEAHHAADYRLGVFHVVEGIIPRHPLAAVHSGATFVEGAQPWMPGLRG